MEQKEQRISEKIRFNKQPWTVSQCFTSSSSCSFFYPTVMK